MTTLPPPVSLPGAAATAPASVSLSWRDCLHMSPEVAAIVMGVTPAQAEASLRAAATRRSRHDRAGEVVADFKHSALAFLTPGHAPLTQTYRLILNKPVAETYACRGCRISQPLPDSGLESLCDSCSAALKDRLTQEKTKRAERKANTQKPKDQATAPAVAV